jgi:hypothetical protein
VSADKLVVALECAVKDAEESLTRLSELLESLPISNDRLGFDFSNSNVATKILFAKWIVGIMKSGGMK